MPAATRVLAPLAAGLSLHLLPAQQPVLSLPRDARMHVQSWTTSTGLPQNTVTTLLQARDGMLWVGTFGGLCRFDGLQWNVRTGGSDDQLDQRVTGLWEDPDGTMWITTQAPALQRLRGGTLEAVAQLPGSEALFVRRLRDGRLVCGTDADVFVVGERGNVAPLAAQALHGGRLVLRVPGDDEWLVGDAGVHRLGAGPAQRLFERSCTAAIATADGAVYVGSEQGLLRWQQGRFETVAELPAAAPRRGAVTALAENRSGELWVAYQGLLCRFSPARTTPSLVLPISHRVRLLHTTDDGSVWVGFDGVGLARLRASEVVLAAQLGEDGAPIEPDSVHATADGAWLVGTDHGLYRWQGNRFARDERFGVRAIGAIHGGSDRTWFGMHRGILELRDDTVREHVAQKRFGRVRAIHVDAAERVWCGTDDGVWWYEHGEWHEPPAAFAARGEVVKLIAPGAGGDLWIGTTHALVCIDAQLAVRRRLCLGVELPHGEVRAVLPRDRGRVWLATYGGGFVALDGDRRTVVGTAAGLLDRFVCSVLPLEQHWLVGSNRGTFLVDPDDLDLVADGARTAVLCRPLLGAKGPAAEANGGVQPAIARAGSTVMLCGVGGLLEVDLAGLQPVAKAPRCRIERVLAGGRPAAIENGVIRLGADGERVFTVDVTAPEFDLPELLRFRWRLLPGDGAWSPPSTARTVSFDVAGPGEHAFEVAALGADEAANVAPVRIAIVVEPRASERTSFRIGALVVLGAVAWLLLHLSGRRHARSTARLAKLVDERTAELRQLHAELERRVAERTRELQDALQRIEFDHEQRLALERELQTFQRMESLGALAGGIAHDFNNLLTVVLGNASLIEMESRCPPALLKFARHIRGAAEQGQMLTRHLLAVASQESVTTTVLDLGASVRALQPLLEQLAGDAVRVEVEAATASVLVRIAHIQIEQILTNLCANARDAMPEGGTVRIAVRAAAGRALLDVGDTGPGMTDDVKRRAFEPFFTTKARRGGTGMGLATVYGITKQAGGTVTIDSEPGRGTTFSFSLPLAD